MSFYYSPVMYGINDITISGESSSFNARIYYPSEAVEVRDVPILNGTYPLIAFAHGDRRSESGLCPPDVSEDYKKWGSVLHLLARCGFVVISVAVHDVIGNSESTAIRVERAIAYARSSWQHRAVLHHPQLLYMDPDITPASEQSKTETSRIDPKLLKRLGVGVGHDIVAPMGPPTSLGVAGHSWGARAMARVAVRGNAKVLAIASIAGSWDENAAIDALVKARIPTVMMAGAEDHMNASYLTGLWASLVVPKHQAMLQSLGHWDWFGEFGSIRPCDTQVPRPRCPVGWQTASEVVLAFMTKYLYNHWWRPPYLLGSPGSRPPLLHWYEKNRPCAMKLRWNDPMYTGGLGQIGDVTLGNWTSWNPW
jgi:dienelactone hydrolase